MQYLNDDNMEELFREAAENYPLKVTGADWNKVQAALLPDKTATGNKSPNEKKLLWLLLLLFIPLICTVYNNRNINTGSEKSTLVQTEPNTIDRTILQNNKPDPAADLVKNKMRAIAVKPPAGLPAAQPLAFFKPARFKRRNAARSNFSTGAADISVTGKGDDPVSETAKAAMQISPAETNTDESQNVLATTDPDADKKTTQPANKNPLTDFVVEDKKKQNDSSKTAQKEKTKNQKSAKFYVSLLGGPDMSKVKSENVKKIGLSTGLSAGYNINKHWAIEAGAFYSEKHYKSDYKYFNNSKTQWPTGATVTNLEGTCKMIELPVTLRYNFNVQKKNKFFAAAGLSSYMMKKEDYGYNYSGYYAGYPFGGYADKTYINSSKNWLSVLQLSAGWQRNVGKKIALRVQPYYNVPLKGVGIGSLPISGAGVLAGVSIGIK